MKICHISDSHGARQHTKFTIPECDVLLHTGDIGGRTSVLELNEFLIWFEQQPAKKKIFIAGNHDICLDKNKAVQYKQEGNVYGWSIQLDNYNEALTLIDKYDVVYLNGTDYVYEGIKFHGSPYSPSFHRQHWAFNADRGAEIMKQWGKIPSDVDVLLTHTPPYNMLDNLREYAEPGEDIHVGCQDLMGVIKKRLLKLKLHCFGHIHDNYGIVYEPISNKRRVLFSNGAMLTNQYDILINKPLIITI